VEKILSADISSELLAYHAFIKSTLSKGGSIDADATPATFLEYQVQLNRLRATLQPAAERFRNGDLGSEIDIDELVDEVLQDKVQRGDRA
jgi:hypothetical protein